jgi:DNA-binding LytR/AlgR family response regulator
VYRIGVLTDKKKNGETYAKMISDYCITQKLFPLLETYQNQEVFFKEIQSNVPDIVEFESGEEFLLAAKERPFTVLFLDIYMGGANGIETAKELRKTDADCLLIFTTTSTDHALEGFRVRALHYLVKPYNEKEISTLMDEILARIPDSGKYIDVKVNGSNIQIPFKNIIYAEHFSHMIYIHTTGGKELVTRQSFEMFTASLKMDSRFYLCSRGVVINLEHAVDFDGTMFLMDDDSNISVSRKLIKNARQVFIEFLFQRGK